MIRNSLVTNPRNIIHFGKATHLNCRADHIQYIKQQPHL